MTPPEANNVVNKYQLIILLFIDISLVLIHFLFALFISKELFNGLYNYIWLNIYPDSESSQIVAIAIQLSTHIATLYWLTLRLAEDMNITIEDLIYEKFGFKKLYISRNSLFICLFQILGLGLIALIQYNQNIWTFSFNNFYSNNEIDISRVMDLIVFAPLREEVAFRGVLFYTIYRRLGSLPSLAILCSFITNTTFGLLHLANLYGSKFSLSYISLQCGLGVLVGTFYSLRFFRSKSLTDVLIMHMFNNFCSCLLPIGEFDIFDPAFYAPFIESIEIGKSINLDGSNQIENKNNDKKEKLK